MFTSKVIFLGSLILHFCTLFYRCQYKNQMLIISATFIDSDNYFNRNPSLKIEHSLSFIFFYHEYLLPSLYFAFSLPGFSFLLKISKHFCAYSTSHNFLSWLIKKKTKIRNLTIIEFFLEFC